MENENIIFIKGTPTRPECKFTREVVKLLEEVGLEGKYAHFNIFEDEEMRQDMKKINKYETYPQIYLKNKFIGGIDALKRIRDDGSLEKIMNGCSDLFIKI